MTRFESALLIIALITGGVVGTVYAIAMHPPEMQKVRVRANK